MFQSLAKQKQTRYTYLRSEKLQTSKKLLVCLRFYPSLFHSLLYFRYIFGNSVSNHQNTCLVTSKRTNIVSSFKISRYLLKRKVIDGVVSGVGRAF